MADEEELVVSEVESSGGASEDVAPPESQDDEQRQPEPPVEPDFSKLDLSELPQFREYQSRQDQRLAALQQESVRAQQEAEKAREEARQARMAGMDDFEKVAYERDEFQNRYLGLEQQLEEERQMQAAMQYRDQQLRTISEETGVPIDKLDVSSPDAAWRSAVAQLRERATKPAEQAAEQDMQERLAQERAANTVDLGGGSPQTVDARYRAQWNQLKKRRAPAADMYKAMLGAAGQ